MTSKKLAICIPTHGQWAPEFGESLAAAMAMLATQGGRHFGLTGIRIHSSSGSLLPQSRDNLAKEALDDGADWLLWLDCDMRFPSHLPLQLMSHGQPFIGVNYARKQADRHSCAFGEHEGRTYSIGWSEGESGLLQVAAVGFGCLLVKREVYEKLEQPWHPIGWSAETQDYIGEDLTFCRAVRAAGYPVLIDCDLSHEVGHVGSFEYRLNGGGSHGSI